MTKNAPFVTTVLTVAGHAFDADALTSVVGLQPTRIWHQRHERVKEIAPDLPTMGWQYKLEKQPKWNIGEAIDELLRPFWKKKDELNAFVTGNHLRVSIRCIPHGDASEIEYIIGPEILMKLALIDASLSLAVYTGGTGS